MEERLEGGHTTEVVRVGDTVRRPVGAWTPAVHALLRHLISVGFDGAPQVLGVDDRGREVLGFVEGEVGTLSPDSPLPPWFRTPHACRAVGRWIRSFQEAQRGFRPDVAHPWRRSPGVDLGPGQVVVHHDVSPYNTVRTAAGSIVILDWDFARPGDPIEEIAWAAWRWAPLCAGTWWHAEYGIEAAEDVPARQRENLAALLDGYGADDQQRRRLADAITAQMTGHADDLEDMARTDPAFATLIDRGYADAARADAAWWAESSLRRDVDTGTTRLRWDEVRPADRW
ncbi:hypothetical protein GCM10025883_00770 [Mobilicoccus caccae]|uniref:Aminoglycoside phosphotransferase domain-containing protein n=2 Tax=Mobilicoccus caccae TaxID=1859295 RepID=A0ABQ6IMP4_9MICO|nr:hypothetical protein GCM10025883_00770 [Mobilicoccus caccae]